MRALTVRQPWASLIACGAKTIETRSWKTSYRGSLLIHAGKASPDLSWEGAGWALAQKHLDHERVSLAYRHAYDVDGLVLPLGAVVAVARLADVVPIVDLESDDGHVDFDEPGGVLWDEGDDLVFDYSGEESPPADGSWAWSVEGQRQLGDFGDRRWAWLLRDVRLIDPVPAKGRQGLWTPDGALLSAVGAAYDVAGETRGNIGSYAWSDQEGIRRARKVTR